MVYHVDAFVLNGSGGNPAGVMYLETPLKNSDMQKIAKEVGYSETAFVRRLDDATFETRFFTPTMEIDLCGHATIGVFGTLLQLDKIQGGNYIQKTLAGDLNVCVKPPLIVMEQPKPDYRGFVDYSLLEACFDMKLEPAMGFDKPFIGSTGVWDLFVPVQNEEVLMNMVANDDAISQLSETYNVVGIHAFAKTTQYGCDYQVRNFAPLYGIPEESATGTSNGLLAATLSQRPEGKTQYKMLQGVGMGLPSVIYTEIEYDNDVISKVWVGGETGKIRVLSDDK